MLPKDPGARSDLLFEELAGRSAAHQPRLYRPYAEVAGGLLARSRTLDPLLASPGTRTALEHTLARLRRDAASVRWLPLDSARGSAIQLVDAHDGRPLATLAADPWSFPAPRRPHPQD
jgi:hypothetical protein